MGRFLRILFGCHGRADRSFFFRGRQFPLCARCTGELIGILCGIPIVIFAGYASFSVSLLLMVPLIVDGFVQQLTSYESNNAKRLVTGFLFGMALVFLFVHFHRTCVKLAGAILKRYYDPERVERALELFL